MTPARAACLGLALAALAVALPAPRAKADDSLRRSVIAWKAADNCARAAFKAYPDYTAEALGKRETYRRLCLRRRNLPGAETTTPPAATPGGDGGI
jgi:hypothetical protein